MWLKPARKTRHQLNTRNITQTGFSLVCKVRLTRNSPGWVLAVTVIAPLSLCNWKIVVSWSVNHKVLCTTWLVRNNHYVCNIALFTLVAVIHCHCTVSFTASLMRPHKEWEEWQVWLGTRITTNISLQWHSDMDPRGSADDIWHIHCLTLACAACPSREHSITEMILVHVAFMRGPDIQSSIFEASFHVPG